MASHPPKKKPEEIDRSNEINMSPEDWEEFGHGVQLFNSGKFWNSHEAWEQVWLRHDEDERLFFQGIIQLAAAYHQLFVKKNLKGLVNNFDKAYAKLVVFQPKYLGVNVTPLVKCIEEGKKEAERLGAAGLEEFNTNLIPKLQFQKPLSPDLLVEGRFMVKSDRFLEGSKLFSQGYYWEAHEVWEDVWRDEEGDAKTLAQAFVQLAAANSFVKLSKLASAVYLFEKALEKFRQFQHLNCGVDVACLNLEIERVVDRHRKMNGEAMAIEKKLLLVATIPLQSTNGS